MNKAWEFLEYLWQCELRYKGVRVNAFGIPIKYSKYKNPNSCYTTLSRLNKKGFITKKSEGWHVTEKGKEYINKGKKELLNFNSSFKNSDPKNLLLSFDVPEERRVERRWLRIHLKKFKYSMIQKSVWVGPSPLPKEFVSYLKEIKLHSCIKKFKLAKAYQFNKANY
jgi:DNA-binding transcriptional regulator PaaX